MQRYVVCKFLRGNNIRHSGSEVRPRLPESSKALLQTDMKNCGNRLAQVKLQLSLTSVTFSKLLWEGKRVMFECPAY